MFILKQALEEVTQYQVFMSGKKKISSHTVISTIGSTVSNLIKESKLKLSMEKLLQIVIYR